MPAHSSCRYVSLCDWNVPHVPRPRFITPLFWWGQKGCTSRIEYNHLSFCIDIPLDLGVSVYLGLMCIWGFCVLEFHMVNV